MGSLPPRSVTQFRCAVPPTAFLRRCCDSPEQLRVRPRHPRMHAARVTVPARSPRHAHSYCRAGLELRLQPSTVRGLPPGPPAPPGSLHHRAPPTTSARFQTPCSAAQHSTAQHAKHARRLPFDHATLRCTSACGSGTVTRCSAARTEPRAAPASADTGTSAAAHPGGGLRPAAAPRASRRSGRGCARAAGPGRQDCRT